MNKDLFKAYIDNPLLLQNENNELLAFLQHYPYFQSAHLLYLKSLEAGKSTKFSEQLKLTVCYAGDRCVLMNLINKKENQNKQVLVNFKSTETYFEQNSEILNNETLETNNQEIKEDNIKSKEDAKVLIIEEKLEEKTELREFPPTPIIPDNKIETKTIKIPAIKKEVNEQHLYSSGSHSQKELLDIINERLKEIDKGKNENDFSVEVIKIEGKKESNTKKQSKLIDEFLSKKPVMPRYSEKETSVNPISEEDEEKEIMTETLAKIYISQKNYEKAINIYSKLSLKYPKKSIYFADQISKIEKLIKLNR